MKEEPGHIFRSGELLARILVGDEPGWPVYVWLDKLKRQIPFEDRI